MAKKAVTNVHILTLNPGSTSTKLAVYRDETELKSMVLSHSKLELEKFDRIWDQYGFRKRIIIDFLQKADLPPTMMDCVVGRGGLLKPIESGTYRVNEMMIQDGREAKQGEHASNLGCVLAYGIGWDFDIPSFIVDPPSVDELDPLARYSGLPEFPRASLFHALNVKATARLAARDLKKPLTKLNLIVVHTGGGISVAALRHGRVVECNNALYNGPFTPERSGTLPTYPLIDACYSGQWQIRDIKKRIAGRGGLVAYLNTSDCRDVEKMIAAGDEKARDIYDAMIYQICCEIGARAVMLKGKIDAIVLTGGIAYSKLFVAKVQEWVGFLGPMMVYPGQDEMRALALGGLRVMRNEEKPKVYPGGEEEA